MPAWPQAWDVMGSHLTVLSGSEAPMYPPTNRAAPLRPRILVVDDDEICRKLFVSILAMSGYAAETAVDGADALLRVAAEKFDLVLTDWEMLGVDGIRLVVALRSARIDLPIIMISGAFSRKSLPAAIRQEVFATLSKPLTASRLATTVASALRRPRTPTPCTE